MPVNDHHTIVYKDNDGWYICEDKWGGELADSFDHPEAVLQTSLNRKGDVKWYDADYYLHGDLQTIGGLFGKSDTHLQTSWNVNLIVPQGFTKGCLTFDPVVNGGTVRKFYMDGGMSMNEQGTPARLWDGFRFDGNHATDGLTFSSIGGVHVYNAHRAIGLRFNTTSSWITTMRWHNVIAYYTEILCEVENNAAQAALGFSTTVFDSVSIQSYSNTYAGFLKMEGNNNLFLNCAVWDCQNSTVAPNAPYAGHPGGVVSTQFLPAATNQYIIGGIMTHNQYDNQAAKGQIRDMSAHGPTPTWDTLVQTISVAGPTDGSKGINIPHGMGQIPDWAFVFPLTTDAMTSQFRVSNRTSTNVTITYLGAGPVPSTPGNVTNLTYTLVTSVR